MGKFGRIFTHETTHFYDRYLAGELTFNEQRLLAAGLPWATSAWSWRRASSPTARSVLRRPGARLRRAFEDVAPILDALDSAGIPLRRREQQRPRLPAGQAGRGPGCSIVLVGTDTVGAAKSRIDLATWKASAGSAQCADETPLRGDDRLLDADGSTAGLLGVWLNRGGADPGLRRLGDRFPAGAAGVTGAQCGPSRLSCRYLRPTGTGRIGCHGRRGAPEL